MKDWIRLLDASYEAHFCKLDHKDCKALADDIRALLREEETARKEIAELKARIVPLKERSCKAEREARYWKAQANETKRQDGT
jgi:hypothetical protein